MHQLGNSRLYVSSRCWFDCVIFHVTVSSGKPHFHSAFHAATWTDLYWNKSQTKPRRSTDLPGHYPQERRQMDILKPSDAIQPSHFNDGRTWGLMLWYCSVWLGGWKCRHGSHLCLASETDVTNQDLMNVTNHRLLFSSWPFKTENTQSCLKRVVQLWNSQEWQEIFPWKSSVIAAALYFAIFYTPAQWGCIRDKRTRLQRWVKQGFLRALIDWPLQWNGRYHSVNRRLKRAAWKSGGAKKQQQSSQMPDSICSLTKRASRCNFPSFSEKCDWWVRSGSRQRETEETFWHLCRTISEILTAPGYKKKITLWPYEHRRSVIMKIYIFFICLF